MVQLPPSRLLQGVEVRFVSGVTPSPLHTSDVEPQVGTQHFSAVPWKSALWNQPLHSGHPQAAPFSIRHRHTGIICHSIICNALAPPSKGCESVHFASNISIYIYIYLHCPLFSPTLPKMMGCESVKGS